MDCNRGIGLKVIAVLIAVFSLFIAFELASAQAPEEYFFEQGKEALEHQDLSGAYYSFQDALSINPDHQGANLFYGLTRVLMITKKSTSSNTPLDRASMNFNKLLDRAGMSSSGRDIFNWTADFKRDPSGNILLPSTSPTGKEWQDFLKNDALPQIDGALDNLFNVQMSYGTTFRLIVENGLGVVNSPNILIDITKSWMPDEWKDYKLLIDGIEYTITGNTQNMIYVSPNWTISAGTHIYDIFGNVEIDYGDVLVLKGFLYLAKAGILTLGSYDLNVDIDAIVTLYNSGKLDIQSNIINTYKNFLNLLTTQQLSDAKTALREGLNILTQAINFITTETDPQDNDLIIIDPLEKQTYLDLLADLNSALDKTTLIRKLGLDVNLKEFFDYPKNLRGYLPIFVGPFYMKRGTFPDPTFGGILPTMTREELEKRFEDYIRDSYPISPLILYDDFLAPRIDTNKWRNGEVVRELVPAKDYIYDDFSNARIDTNKWKYGEWVREIQGGKATLKQASPNPAVVSKFPGDESNLLEFPNPNFVNSIQADVVILEDTIVNSTQTRARIAGLWYNDGLGDMQGEIRLIKDSSGLRADWFIYRLRDPVTLAGDPIGSGTFGTSIRIGVPYTLYIGYDRGAEEFTFRIGTDTVSFNRSHGLPSWDQEPNQPWKAFGTRIRFNDATSSGYISATFDNVFVNGSLYDNFSSTTIDPIKWSTYEFVREIKGGKLRSKVRSSSGSTSPISNDIYFANLPSLVNIQTNVTLLSYKNEGLYERATIAGWFYNDGTPGGGRIGDVGAQVRIGGTGVDPVAEWAVFKRTDFAGNSIETVDSGTFSTPISTGKPYTLFLGWDGTKFTFKINNEDRTYEPKTEIYQANPPSGMIGTRAIPETDKKEATIEALFDDVKIIAGQDYKLISKIASPNPSLVGVFPYGEPNWLYFPDPNSLESIQADVTVLESKVTGSAQARARLAGVWYLAAAPGQGLTGDMWANVEIRETSAGLFAQWSLGTCINPDCTSAGYWKSGNFSTPISLGKTYTLYIKYVNNQFVFRVNDEEITYGADLPPWVGPAVNPIKGIGTRVGIDDPASSGYISTLFDNVYANRLLYDKFSSSTIDETKWISYESVKEISGGKFRSKIRSSSTSTSSPASRLEFLYPSEINAIQTKATPLVFQNDQGTSPRARIAGTFYNDGTRGTESKDRTGDVGAQVRIGGSGLSPVAEWIAWKTIDFAGAVPEVIASGIFNTPISLNKTYTLFLGWDGTKFTFKIDNEVAYYAPETGVYQTYNPSRSIETQILDPKGKEAIIEALFDDVMVSGPVLSASPKSHDFGKVIVHTSAPKTITLSNNGSTNIGIKSIDLLGGDAWMFDVTSSTCTSLSPTIPPKGKCDIVTSFWPASEGAKSAILRVVINATPGNIILFVPLKGTGVLETIYPPTGLGGLTSGTTGTTYNFTTGGSSSSLGPTHSIQYLFDWDDGTNSGWLPVGTTSAKKTWASSGTYYVKAVARCATHKAVVSNWSAERKIDIKFHIHPTSPLYEHFNVDSLYPPKSPPTFKWTKDESFISYKVQFSPDYKFKSIPVKVKVSTSTTSAAISPTVWKTILLIPGKLGGVVYWRVVGTWSDMSIATSEVAFIIVDQPRPVGNPEISPTCKTLLPTLSWKNNWNIKFKVWFGNDRDFAKSGMKKTALDFNITNLNDMFTKALTSTQWATVRSVVGDVSGSTVYWFVESWDGVNRYSKTEVDDFILTACGTGACSYIAGTWNGTAFDGVETLRITLHLFQNGCNITGTIESPDSCPGQCGIPPGQITGSVNGNIASGTVLNSVWVDCDTCQIICYGTDQGTFTVNGDKMSGIVKTEDCETGEYYNIKVNLTRSSSGVTLKALGRKKGVKKSSILRTLKIISP